jgi:lipopolysaccharide export system protein LptC
MNSVFNRHNVVLFMVLAMLVLLSLWMQFDLLEDPDESDVTQEVNDPDYYVEYLTSFGVDADGKQYQLEADRLVHFPQDNKSLLDRPHITQYVEGGGPTHIYADSGWLFADGDEILMTDNVKVIRSQGQGLGGAATTDRMRIKLKPKK